MRSPFAPTAADPDSCASAVEVIAVEQVGATGIAVDGANVFWANQPLTANFGAVMRMTRNGRQLVEVVRDYKPALITADDEFVYWVGWLGSGHIGKRPRAGGDPTVIFPAGANRALARHGSDLYVAADFAGVYRIDVASFEPELLVSDPLGAVALAVDADFVFWSDDAGVVSSLAHDGDEITRVADLGERLVSLVATEETLIFKSATRIGIIRRSDGQIEVIASLVGLGGVSFGGLAVRGDHIYWTDHGAGTIMRSSMDGDATCVVAWSPGPHDLAIDGADLCWTDDVAGIVACATIE